MLVFKKSFKMLLLIFVFLFGINNVGTSVVFNGYQQNKFCISSITVTNGDKNFFDEFNKIFRKFQIEVRGNIYNFVEGVSDHRCVNSVYEIDPNNLVKYFNLLIFRILNNDHEKILLDFLKKINEIPTKHDLSNPLYLNSLDSGGRNYFSICIFTNMNYRIREEELAELLSNPYQPFVHLYYVTKGGKIEGDFSRPISVNYPVEFNKMNFQLRIFDEENKDLKSRLQYFEEENKRLNLEKENLRSEIDKLRLEKENINKQLKEALAAQPQAQDLLSTFFDFPSSKIGRSLGVFLSNHYCYDGKIIKISTVFQALERLSELKNRSEEELQRLKSDVSNKSLIELQQVMQHANCIIAMNRQFERRISLLNKYHDAARPDYPFYNQYKKFYDENYVNYGFYKNYYDENHENYDIYKNYYDQYNS